MQDKLGSIILEGERIAYAQRSGNSSWLSLGRVVEVDEERGVQVHGDGCTKAGWIPKNCMGRVICISLLERNL